MRDECLSTVATWGGVPLRVGAVPYGGDRHATSMDGACPWGQRDDRRPARERGRRPGDGCRLLRGACLLAAGGGAGAEALLAATEAALARVGR
jgi:hypothetical protein